MRDTGDLTDVGTVVNDAQAFELVVVEAIIVRVFTRRREELGAAQRIRRRAIMNPLEEDKESSLVHTHGLHRERVFLLSLLAMQDLAHGVPDLRFVRGGLDNELALDAVRFDNAADE